jgi:hypothetical protein
MEWDTLFETFQPRRYNNQRFSKGREYVYCNGHTPVQHRFRVHSGICGIFSASEAATPKFSCRKVQYKQLLFTYPLTVSWLPLYLRLIPVILSSHLRLWFYPGSVERCASTHAI